MNLEKQKKILSIIWEIIPNKFKFKAKKIVFLNLFNMAFETLSLGAVVPLLLAISNKPDAANSSIFGSLNRLLFKHISIELALLVLVCVFLLKNIYGYYLTKVQANFIFELERVLSDSLMGKYLNQPYAFFLDKNSAELIRNTISEVSLFSHNAVAPLCAFFSELLVMLGILAVLFIINPSATFFALVILGSFGFYFHRSVKSKIAKWSDIRQIGEAKRIQILQESIGAIKEVQLTSSQDFFSSKFSLYNDLSSKSGAYQQLIQASPRFFLEFLAVFLLCAFVLTAKVTNLDLIPILGLYATAAYRLMPSANRINFAIQAIKFSEPTIRLLAKELSLDKSFIEEPVVGFNFHKKIVIENISFHYPNSKNYIFRNLSLTINKGDVICISGQSGIGKSTLIDLICGLLEPTQGTIYVDDKDIFKDIRSWQRNIAYVPQNIFLIDGTIRENILFSINDQDSDEDKLNETIKSCGLEEFIDEAYDGLNASIGERGCKLSGGQKQRIGLARALYRGADLLVLDEATNALDAITEREVINSILSKKKDMTILWISHGDAPMQSANKIISVKKGLVQVIECMGQ